MPRPEPQTSSHCDGSQAHAFTSASYWYSVTHCLQFLPLGPGLCTGVWGHVFRTDTLANTVAFKHYFIFVALALSTYGPLKTNKKVNVVTHTFYPSRDRQVSVSLRPA